jgi:hypothetical protein
MLTPRERRAVAYHEAAHAAVAYALGDVPVSCKLHEEGGWYERLGINNSGHDPILMDLAGMAMDRRLGSKISRGYHGDYVNVWRKAFDVYPNRADAIKVVRAAEKRIDRLVQHVAPGAMLLGGELYERGSLDRKQIDNILSKTVTRLKTPDAVAAMAAMDRRRIDHDGRLHVDTSNLSKAAINPYRGEEIPYWERLGLEPKKVYMLLRHPDELKRAADSFNGLPILDTHVPMDADSHLPYLVVGTTGTRAAFKPPYLTNAISLWTRDAIDGVKSGEKKQLSCAYSYMPVMQPGVYQGHKYDGIMTQLRGNHVAIVDEGRCGADCVVGDSANRKVVRRFAMYGAYDQLPKAMQPSQCEKDGVARVGEKLQAKKERLVEAGGTKSRPSISAAFDTLHAWVENPESPRALVIMAAELLKQCGLTPEQILTKLTQMSTPNDYENKKLNWNGSGAAAENEEPRMPMQQLEDPNRVAATTNQPRGPTQHETFSRDLANSPRDQFPVRGQASGIRSAAGAEPGTRAPSTRLRNESVDAYAGLEGLIRLLDLLDEEEDKGGAPMDAQQPIAGQGTPETTGTYYDQEPLKQLPMREAPPRPVKMPAQDYSCATGDARIMEQRRAPQQRLDQHLRNHGMDSEAKRAYAVDMGRKIIAKNEALACDSAGDTLKDFFAFLPGARKIDVLSTPSCSMTANKKIAQDASTIYVWEFNPITNILEQRPVDRGQFNNTR